MGRNCQSAELWINDNKQVQHVLEYIACLGTTSLVALRLDTIWMHPAPGGVL